MEDNYKQVPSFLIKTYEILEVVLLNLYIDKQW